MGKWLHESSFSCAKKRGIRTKTSLGNRFIGCRIDSSERSFGRTFVSNELLTPVIYKRGREFGVATKLPGGVDFDAPLRPLYHCACYSWPFRVSSLPPYRVVLLWTRT